MRIKKKIGIGLGVVILSFVVLVIITQIWWASLTPEERLQIEEKREAKELQERIDDEQRALQQKIDDEQGRKSEELIELSELQSEKEKSEETEKLDAEELQKIIAGFESYNKSVKILLDMCVNVESENDFRQMMSLIAEQEEKFLDTTSGYGAIRNTLMSEGYGDHPVLGPLMEQSGILVGATSDCMEVLAWEFGG